MDFMTSYIIIVVTLHDNSCERKEKPGLSCAHVAVELSTGGVEVLFCRTFHQITFMHQECQLRRVDVFVCRWA